MIKDVFFTDWFTKSMSDEDKIRIIKKMHEYCEDRRKDLENIKANGFELGKVNVLLDWMDDRDILFMFPGIDQVTKHYFLKKMANLIIELALIEDKESPQTIASNRLKTVLPKSVKPGSEYQFPTPAGATWEQFMFEFTATEILSVTCGQTQQRLEPVHLKMKDQRSGKITNQWTLLLALAKTGGNLLWQGSNVNDKLKKQKQELANKLKQYFGLSEDPLPWSRKENCYKARFIIRADDNVLRQLNG